jgi:hypothetical protein
MCTLPFTAAALAALCLASHRPLASQGPTGPRAGEFLSQFEIALPPDCEVNALAVAPGGRTVLAGHAYSDDFPTTPGAIQPLCYHNQYGDCVSPFVMVFSPRGELEYSSFVGGGSERWWTSVASGQDGGIWILFGGTWSAPDPVFAGCGPSQPVLARIRPGSPGYERFICVGGPNAYGLSASSVAIAGDGSIWVVGQAEQRAVLQTVNAWQAHVAGIADVFAIRYAAGGQETLLATYLGGRDLEYPAAIAIAPDGDLVIVGLTQSFDFPAVRPLQGRLGSIHPYVSDGFITRLDAGGRLLEYSTWLGGAESDDARSVAVDASGNAYLVGETGSPDFPVTASTDLARVWPGPYSGFLASLDPAGRLRFSTRIASEPRDVAALEDGSLAVAGTTSEPGFPRVGRVSRLRPSTRVLLFPFFLQTDDFASELVRSTLVPVATGLDPQVEPPTPALGMENRIEASALDARYLYLAGRTALGYRPFPSADVVSFPTGHYLKKWYVGGPPERERRRERR